MNRFKYILGITLNIIWFPALIIHELSHLIFTLLFFRIPKAFSISFSLNKPVCGSVDFKEKDTKNRFVFSMIALAPLFEIILVIILAQYYMFFNFVLIYQAIAIHYTLPSANDLNIVLQSMTCPRKLRDFLFMDIICEWLFPNYWEDLIAEQTAEFIDANF